jgi:uncharacterized Rmd1/YagE family protein
VPSFSYYLSTREGIDIDGKVKVFNIKVNMSHNKISMNEEAVKESSLKEIPNESQ